MAEEEIPMGTVTPEEKDDGGVEDPSTPVKKRPASKAKTPKSKSPKAKSPKAKTPKGKKPKAKGKNKPKPKAGSLKRPAASGETVPKKKPAAHGWAAGLQEDKEEEAPEVEEDDQENVEEEEEQDNADFFECDEAKKDRSKDNKFKALLSEGSLPDYVVQAWKKTLSMKKGRTEEQRKIVNQVLDRTKDGKLMVNLEKPMFAQMREQFSQSKSSTKDKALPKLLFMGKFNLKDEQFLQGLQDGEFFESRDSSGRLVYSWTQLEQVESRGSLTTVSMAAKQELDKNQKQVEAGAFDSWRGGLFSRDKTKALHDAASSGSAPLALCDRETELGESLWKKAQEQLHDAKRAYEKLEKDVRKGLQDVGVDAKEDPLWTTLKL